MRPTIVKPDPSKANYVLNYRDLLSAAANVVGALSSDKRGDALYRAALDFAVEHTNPDRDETGAMVKLTLPVRLARIMVKTNCHAAMRMAVMGDPGPSRAFAEAMERMSPGQLVEAMLTAASERIEFAMSGFNPSKGRRPDHHDED